MLFGVRDGGVELFGAGTRADGEKRHDPSSAGTVKHGVAVGVELREIDVGVRVDELHGRYCDCPSR